MSPERGNPVLAAEDGGQRTDKNEAIQAFSPAEPKTGRQRVEIPIGAS
jgi:hypothetical protein